MISVTTALLLFLGFLALSAAYAWLIVRNEHRRAALTHEERLAEDELDDFMRPR
jgi:hypothetical protein